MAKENTGKTAYHLPVEADYKEPLYFLHLLVKPTTKLKDIDQFLRGIWLECCGHMSEFSDYSIGKTVESIFEKNKTN